MPEVLENRIHARGTARMLRLDLLLQRIALVGAILGVWWVLALGVPHYILPGPVRVWTALTHISSNGDLWSNLGITLGRVGAGFILATAIGLPLGIVFGANRRLGEFFEPVIPVMNTVSSAIWAIFAIIWFGVSNATTIFVVFMTAMPLIITHGWPGSIVEFHKVIEPLTVPTAHGGNAADAFHIVCRHCPGSVFRPSRPPPAGASIALRPTGRC